MWTHVNGMSVSSFKKDERGAILVFFALACAAIFLVAALTFDLGRRASTQTELQSLTDHIALAAAGELDGFPNAIIRAQNAASGLFVRADDATDVDFVIGEGDTQLGPDDYYMYFYETLPDNDEDPLTGALDVGVRANDALARFVRVALVDDRGEDKRIRVPWVFARLLTIFGQENLPSDLVGADSTAGYTSLACDVAPVFFCMPTDNSPVNSGPWNPKDHIGETILLRSGGGGGNGNGNGNGNGGGSGEGFWEPGNFTWLDVREQVPESVVDAGGDCAGLSGNNLYECLFAAEEKTTLCFQNGLLTTLPGQKEGNVAAVFDTRFDIFRSSSSQVQDDPRFRPAPVVNKAYTANGVCQGNQIATNTTVAHLPDDCHNSGGGCTGGRFGDGDWSSGRLEYVETNYSRDADSVNNRLTADVLDGGEMLTIGSEQYHRDDPFRPDPTVDDYPDTMFSSLPTGVPYTSFEDLSRQNLINENRTGSDSPIPYEDFPVIPNGYTRWEYYQAEVAASLYEEPTEVYDPAREIEFDDEGNVITKVQDTFQAANSDLRMTGSNETPLELIRDIQEPSGGSSYNRTGATLPYCSVNNGFAGNYSKDPRRRTLVAAAVDCEAQKITGKQTNVRATWFLEVFLVSPSDDDPVDNKKKEIFVEIISPALNSGEYITTPGRFRNLVQLYR